MRTALMLMAALALAAARGEMASESDIRKRNRSRREMAELVARRNALKERIRLAEVTAETLNVTAELMEGVRKFPPQEREHLSELRSFEAGAPKAIAKGEKDASACVHRWLTLSEGRRYRFFAGVRAEDVQGTNVKFGLMVPMPNNGPTQWPSASVGSGTFDWRDVSFDYDLPAGVTSVLLLYGLESGSGKVEFRDVTVMEVSRVFE